MYDDAAGEVFGAVGGEPAAAPHLRKGGDVVETEFERKADIGNVLGAAGAGRGESVSMRFSLTQCDTG